MQKPDIKDLGCVEVASFLANASLPPYRASQILQWLYQKGVSSFEEMSNLSRPLRERLACEFRISSFSVRRVQQATDGTRKYLFVLEDGEGIETVLIPDRDRRTLCLSTQVGCGLGCRFCATATMGLKRNLKSSEILNQVLAVKADVGKEVRITNVVLMGMGEPLANYRETLKALEILTDEAGLGFSSRRVTLSTVGLVPGMEQLLKDSKINLAVSLHATTDELRSRLMPINRKFPLRELTDCCRSLPLSKRRRITFEYLLLKGLNHSADDARRLALLLRGIPAKVNLIPFNPFSGNPFERPSDEEVKDFKDRLRNYGFQVSVRVNRGQEIEGACGQLRVNWKMEAPPKTRDAGWTLSA
jgi:23S rRNA (adenine2503-C2)-methyltransferase